MLFTVLIVNGPLKFALLQAKDSLQMYSIESYNTSEKSFNLLTQASALITTVGTFFHHILQINMWLQKYFLHKRPIVPISTPITLKSTNFSWNSKIIVFYTYYGLGYLDQGIGRDFWHLPRIEKFNFRGKEPVYVIFVLEIKCLLWNGICVLLLKGPAFQFIIWVF